VSNFREKLEDIADVNDVHDPDDLALIFNEQEKGLIT
jgi:hypothetical protein